jgi:hypothetical protein
MRNGGWLISGSFVDSFLGPAGRGKTVLPNGPIPFDILMKHENRRQWLGAVQAVK